MARIDDEPKPLPAWAAILIIIVCLVLGGGFVWWYMSAEVRPVAVRANPSRPAQLGPFMDAVRQGDLPRVTAMLNELPALASMADPEQNAVTPLHTAAWEGRVEVATLLIDRGANLEAIEREYQGTPMNWAIVAGQEKMVELLIARGTKLNDPYLEAALEGSRGGFDFAPNPPAAHARIANLLKSKGLKDPNPKMNDFSSSVAGTQDPAAENITTRVQPGGEWGADMPLEGNLVQSLIVIGSRAERSADGLKLSDDQHYTGAVTPGEFTVPVQIDVEAKTDSTNIRLYFAGGSIILNWEPNQSELRFQEPVTGKGRGLPGAGSISANEWHRIQWIIEKDVTRLVVDGQERLNVTGNFEGAKGRVGIGPAWGSTVVVRSLSVAAPAK